MTWSIVGSKCMLNRGKKHEATYERKNNHWPICAYRNRLVSCPDNTPHFFSAKKVCVLAMRSNPINSSGATQNLFFAKKVSRVAWAVPVAGFEAASQKQEKFPCSYYRSDNLIEKAENCEHRTKSHHHCKSRLHSSYATRTVLPEIRW